MNSRLVIAVTVRALQTQCEGEWNVGLCRVLCGGRSVTYSKLGFFICRPQLRLSMAVAGRGTPRRPHSRLNSSVTTRDLDLSDRLEDEPLALGYLLLLEEYGVGKIWSQLTDRRSDNNTAQSQPGFLITYQIILIRPRR